MTPDQSQPPKLKHTEAAHLEAGPDAHELILVKGDQRFSFRCTPGSETELLNQLAVVVADDANDLTWFDAAVLAHQLGQRMSQRLTELQNQRKPA
ncbi:MAG: hypothetical protein AAF750_18665 [Planctomycetota bacterium]